MYRGDLKLFVLDGESPLSVGLSERLGIAVSPHELRIFEDGEHKIRPLCDVRRADVYILATALSRKSCSVHDQLCRILFFIGAVRDAGASHVTLIAPYLCYSRKDRKTKDFDPTTTQYLARIMESIGLQAVMTIDVHNLAAYQNAFRVPTEHLEAAPLLVKALENESWEGPIAILSPDLGGIKRAQKFRELMEKNNGISATFSLVYKERSQNIVTAGDLIGRVDGYDVVIVDDMIGTGTTMQSAAKTCLDRGARRVLVVASHALFTGEAQETLSDPSLCRVLVTNTVPHPSLQPALRSKMHVVDVSALIARAVTT